jgi:Cu/Ag efflux protein CusF
VTKQHPKQVAAEQTEKTNKATNNVTRIMGEVTGIMLKVKDAAGKTYLLRVDDPNSLKGIKAGDSVDVMLKNGKAVAIKKSESKAPAKGTPEAK